MRLFVGFDDLQSPLAAPAAELVRQTRSPEISIGGPRCWRGGAIWGKSDRSGDGGNRTRTRTDAPMPTDLQLSDDQKLALEKELASLKPKLGIGRAASDAPSFESRQRVITRVVKHLHALRTFANSTKEPERWALEDIFFAAGTFPEGFADHDKEADDFAFVWRWFGQAQSIEAIANAALDAPILHLLRGKYVSPYRQGLIGRILPGLFEKIFQQQFPMTREGKGMMFVRHCLAQLGEESAADETIRTCVRNERRVTRQDK